MMRMIRVLAPVVALVALLTMTVGADAKASLIMRANLAGSGANAGVSGKAVYKVDGTKRELEVEIEDANRLKGQRLTVKVNGVTFGTMTVNSLGAASIERSTQLGQAVPTISAGAKVRVVTSTGVLVASGTF